MIWFVWNILGRIVQRKTIYVYDFFIQGLLHVCMCNPRALLLIIGLISLSVTIELFYVLLFFDFCFSILISFHPQFMWIRLIVTASGLLSNFFNELTNAFVYSVRTTRTSYIQYGFTKLVALKFRNLASELSHEFY